MGRKEEDKEKESWILKVLRRLRYGNLSFDVWKVWKSLFVYVWVRKTLTLIIKVFLGSFKSVLCLVLSLSCFGRKISGEKG